MLHRSVWAVGGVLAIAFATVPVVAGQTNLLSINPGVLSFGSLAVGSTVSLSYSLTIYNPGAAPVTITGFSLTGPLVSDFSVSAGSCPVSPNSLSPGYYCYPSLTFTPSAVGLRVANLVVKDVGGSPQTVLLTGEGLAAVKSVGLSPSQVTFPDTPIGLPSQNAPSAQIQVLNTGNVALNVKAVAIAGQDAHDFLIGSNYCNFGSIPAGGYCYMYLSFVPSATGSRRASLEIFDDAPGGKQSVPLLGLGSSPTNMLQYFPAALAFTPLGTSGSEENQITVTNSGSESVGIYGVQVTGQNASDFSVIQNSCPGTLSAFNQCYVYVQFTPQAVGTRLANLQFYDSAAGSPQSVPLEGVLERKVTINFSFSPNPVVFGVQTVGYYQYGYTYLYNQGSETAQISLQIQGPDAADFYVTNYCSSLSPGSNCYIPISFVPSTAGIRVATLMATDSVSGKTLPVTLIGSGAKPGEPLSIGSPSFTPEIVGTTSTGYLYISNYSGAPVNNIQLTLTGGAVSDFSILGNGCPSTLNEFDSCNVQVTFTPSATGTRVAGISLSYSGAGSPVSIPLAGYGLPFTRTITFSPSSLDLGTPPVGVSVTSNASIVNAGTEAVSIASIALAGPNAGDYAITENQCPQSPATLAAGANCQVTLQFTPSALGTRLARLQVADNASGSPQSLQLVGFGSNSLPILQLNPTALNFNPLPLGSSYQQYVYLNNYSGIPISLSSVQIIGHDPSDFILVNSCPATLLNYGSCALYVTFTPSVTGLRTAVLEIQDSATGSPQIVPLAGMGAIATQAIGLTPNPLAFSQPQGIGYTTTTYLTLNNTGTANVLLTGFQISGAAVGDFGIQTNNCPLSPAPLAPNQGCQVTIAFTPSATGVRVATLSVTDSATGSPQSISIVGEGTLPTKSLAVTPSSIDFGPVPVGDTASGLSVSIGNTGNVPVTVRGFTFSGTNAGDFSIGANYCDPIVYPGNYCNVYLDFTPSAVGTRTGAFVITSDATGSPQTVRLSGTGE